MHSPRSEIALTPYTESIDPSTDMQWHWNASSNYHQISIPYHHLILCLQLFDDLSISFPSGPRSQGTKWDILQHKHKSITNSLSFLSVIHLTNIIIKGFVFLVVVVVEDFVVKSSFADRNDFVVNVVGSSFNIFSRSRRKYCVSALFDVENGVCLNAEIMLWSWPTQRLLFFLPTTLRCSLGCVNMFGRRGEVTDWCCLWGFLWLLCCCWFFIFSSLLVLMSVTF